MRDKILAYLLALTAILNVADYAFTLRAVHIMGKAEANPVMDAILHTPFFPIYKVILVPLGIYFLWRVRNKVRFTRHLIRLGAAVGFVVYGALTGWHIWGQFLM